MTDLVDFQVKPVYFKRILLAIDSDDQTSSQQAFNYACTIAKLYQAKMGIVSILETGDLNIYQSLSKDTLNQRRDEIKEEIDFYIKKANEFGIEDIESFVGEGNPGREIVDKFMPQYQPDLVVVGSETKRINNHLGSQASYIVHHANCSVIVVR